MSSFLPTYETMSDEIRPHVAIAIDGGGIKGALIAKALGQLETLTGYSPLRDWPQLKVVAGTSTGSLIATAIAVGYTAAEIFELYKTLSSNAFSQRGPLRPFGRGDRKYLKLLIKLIARLIPSLEDLEDYLLYPAKYEFDPLRQIILGEFEEHPCPCNNPTLGDLGNHLRQKYDREDALTLIITAVGVKEQRTHFLKTTPTESPAQQAIKLVDAMLASSCIPTVFPPVALQIAPGSKSFCVDGGVGSFGNPGYIAAWEMCDTHNPHYVQHGIRGYAGNEVTVFSFGTGIAPETALEMRHGPISEWWALQWLPVALDLFQSSANRHQSRTIVSSYPGIDLRRFQIELPENIGADHIALLEKPWFDTICQELCSRIQNNHHALKAPEYDPEGIREILT